MTQLRFGRSLAAMRGDGVKAKALRSTFWSVFGVFGQNGMRLLSNIVLTRLLFPEAFGLMALVQVFIVALQTFSDIGIQTSIMQSKRGDDPNFLNTAWTLQIIRGFVLWLAACALAWPAAQIYDQPELLLLLPVTALSIIGQGFRPTRAAQASRHLAIGRLTMIQIFVQFVTLVLTGLLAWWWHSVWALAVSQVISTSIGNVMTRLYIPGHPNRLQWERQSVREIIGFGKFIFLSTIATFLISMSDRAILGAYVDVTTFGIYSIALAFGTLPVFVVQAIGSKVLFPLYRIKSPMESEETRRKIFRASRVVSAFGIGIAVVLAFTGDWLVRVLYDARYALAGPMMILFAVNSIPTNVLIGTQSVLLSHGDSRRHFYLTAAQAILQTGLLFLAIHLFGVAGGILAPGLAILLTYPLRARLISHYRAWDPLNDIVGLAVGFLLTSLACALHWDEIVKLFP
ncbi:polysaccharide biosynthesis protein [Sinirhodobacter populi]|uniref:Polysaccharide biosynthesis protein n=1 Tax=Paenirhodobacter populi TaxID=2306993 RepID=A0A443K4Q1_9RHOB|nr:oligosaccharide flippase family protein [Sinirhodobacter populi]RWR27730.1 polysaccharide biosynthesis protein [Sinirhodobacter populi]